MSRLPPARDRRGLTLIELVLTLTILALAGVLVGGAFSTSLRAWKSAERGGRGDLVAGIVLQRIAEQLRAVVDARVRKELGDVEYAAFDAGEDHLRFVTLAAGRPYPVQVSYALADGPDGPHLVCRQHPWPDKEFFGDTRTHPGEEHVAEVTGLTVKVEERGDAADATDDGTDADGPPSPPGVWTSPNEELPASVTVEIGVRADGAAEPATYTITVPLPAVEP